MQRILLNIVLVLLSFPSLSNNLWLGNASFEGGNITFDISWDNSWNQSSEGGNHDAVWLFIKGKTPFGDWVHIDLRDELSSHTSSSPLTIKTVDDSKGVFTYSQNTGLYDIMPTAISLSTSQNLLDYTEIRVFGIEMVYIPQGEFYVGDGASVSSLINGNGNPLLIESELKINLENISIYNSSELFPPEALTSDIPDEFPKGFDPFYVMKYEVSQIQYVDFLNTLSYNQQVNRTSISPSSSSGKRAMVNPFAQDSVYRNGIITDIPGVHPNLPATYGIATNKNSVGMHRAANFLSWGDLSAYLDWAALRPITELEFEKICRGSGIEPNAGEFAWGTSLITNANNPLFDGTNFETVSNAPITGSGLANHGNVVALEGWGLRGVLRTGFAANETTTRLEAGAAYYGVMEMSGNVWEQTVMITSDGLSFIGNFGDGLLSENGDANQPSWCNPITASGVILKGGGWASTIGDVGNWRDLAISDRFYSHIKPSSRRNTIGGRGAR